MGTSALARKSGLHGESIVKISAWSVWHVMAIGVGWELVVLLGSVVMLAIGLWRARTPRTAGERFSGDIALAITPGIRARLVVVVFVPPVLLMWVWLWARLGR
jgi:hypothetical protein